MEKDIKIYADIYEMFQPIFDWLKCNYPSDDATFLVNRNGATMYINHGPSICNKKEWDAMRERVKEALKDAASNEEIERN